MTGFFGWFVVIVGVLAVFNAEKLPALRKMMEEKLKDSVDAAKEGSKLAKSKIKQVKADIDQKKNAPAEEEPEENTPEEINESMQFMGEYVNKAEAKKSGKKKAEEAAPVDLGADNPFGTPVESKPAENASSAPDAPVDLEHRD